MKTLIKFVIYTTLITTLFGCGEEDEAKKLGFSSVVEMNDIHAKGWHTKAKYDADSKEQKEAEKLGFSNAKSTPWYGFPGGLHVGETKCLIAKGDQSPSELIKNFEFLHKQYSIVDNEKIDGVVVDMTLRVEMDGGVGEIRWIRGEEKCQRLLDQKNKGATDAINSKNKAIDSKYGQ